MAAKDTIVNLVIGAQDRASRTLTRFQKSLGGIKTKVAAVGAAVATYFGGRAIAQFFGSAVSQAASFEEQMDRVAAVSGATAEELEALTAAAEKMGAETSFTATQSAQALELLARAGLSAKDSVQTLPTVLNLAKGSGLELAEAASQITSTTSAMGLSFSEAGRVADVLTRAAASANTNVQQLGNAMSYAGPVAASLGLEVEDVAALIGKFSDAGIRGERAGTALRSILSQMSDPASKASRALQELGISAEDPIQAITQLAKVGPEGAEAIRAFGLEAGPALQALLNQGAGSLRGLRKELEGAAGASAAAAKTMADNLPGALKGLGSAWDAIKQKLAAPLLEPIKNEVLDLTERLREFASGPEIKQLANALVSGFKDTAKAVKGFVGEFDFKQAINDTGDFATKVSGNLSVVGNTLIAVGSGIRLFLNGFTAGVRTIGAAATGFMAEISSASAKALDFFGKSKLADKARLIADSMARTSKKFMDAVKEDSKDVQGSWDSLVEALVKLDKKHEETAEKAEQSADRQTAANEKVSESVKAVSTEVEKLQRVYAANDQAITNNSDATEQYSERLKQTIKNVQQQTDVTNENTDAEGENTKGTKDAADAKGKDADATRRQTQETDKNTESTNRAAAATGGLYMALKGLVEQHRKFFAGFGEEAAAEFDALIERVTIADESVTMFMRRYSRETERLRQRYEDLAEMTESARNQSEALKDELEGLERATLRELDAATHTADALERVDNVDLSGVRSEIERLRDENERLRGSISGTLTQLQDEFDRLAGNQKAIEEREYQRQRKDLRKQLEAARKIGDAEAEAQARQALDLLDQIHQKRLDDIKAERERLQQREQEEAERRRRARDSEEKDRQRQRERDRERDRGQNGGGSNRWTVDVNVHALGKLTNQQADALGRQLIPVFEKIARRKA